MLGGEQDPKLLEDILRENWHYYSTGGIKFAEMQNIYKDAGERYYYIYIYGVLALQHDYDSYRITELYGGHIFYINGRSKAADEELHGKIDPAYEKSYVKARTTARQ